MPVMFAVACTQSQNKVSGTVQSAPSSATPFKLISPAFDEGGNIPTLYTCDSTNISPELHWNKIAGNVASYVLIMDDPDAPMGTWVHWVMFNIPSADTMLPSYYALDSNMAGGIRQGITSFGSTGYGGPVLLVAHTITFLNYLQLTPYLICHVSQPAKKLFLQQ